MMGIVVNPNSAPPVRPPVVDPNVQAEEADSAGEEVVVNKEPFNTGTNVEQVVLLDNDGNEIKVEVESSATIYY